MYGVAVGGGTGEEGGEERNEQRDQGSDLSAHCFHIKYSWFKSIRVQQGPAKIRTIYRQADCTQVD